MKEEKTVLTASLNFAKKKLLNKPIVYSNISQLQSMYVEKKKKKNLTFSSLNKKVVFLSCKIATESELEGLEGSAMSDLPSKIERFHKLNIQL